MAADRPRPEPFDRIDASGAGSPIVISVPHAGRDYPAALLAGSRLPRSRLEALEDRHVDQVVLAAGLTGATILIARRARAWIDLNRDPRELDPGMLVPEPAVAAMLRTAKVRGGLGLVPRHAGNAGEINKTRLSLRAVEARIAEDHLPYHGAIAAALAAARARFGIALLIDCHSMPTLPAIQGRPQARIVIGDRFGRSADAGFSETALSIAEASGLPPAHNTPYAGGYTLDRHGIPPSGIHALQIEIDRGLYLDPAMDAPGPGLARMARWFATLVAALADECAHGSRALAAE